MISICISGIMNGFSEHLFNISKTQHCTSIKTYMFYHSIFLNSIQYFGEAKKAYINSNLPAIGHGKMHHLAFQPGTE